MIQKKSKQKLLWLALVLLLAAAPLMYLYGRSLWIPVYFKLIGKRTVAQAMEEFGESAARRFLPHFRRAGVTYPPEKLILLGLKRERQLEVWAETAGQVTFIHSYPVKEASGTKGPKLQEGDRQVPEGFYRISGLNPNSSYHLSMKLNYPNAFDRQHAAEEGRGNLGGNIFIHGKEASIGCLAMGDTVIEELFVMVEQVGRSRVSVILAPRDPRASGLKADPGLPLWTADLYQEISRAFSHYTRPEPA